MHHIVHLKRSTVQFPVFMKISKSLFFFLLSLGFYTVDAQEKKQSDSPRDSVVLEKAAYYLTELRAAYAKADYDLFKIYGDSLHDYAKANGEVNYQILGMLNQAVYYNNLGEQNKSIELYRNAYALTEAIPENHRTKLLVLVNLGNSYVAIEYYDKAIATMNEVLQLLKTYENNPKIEASALNGLANSYKETGDLAKALEYRYRVKELGERMEDEGIVATALSTISDEHYRQGEYLQAIETGEQALALPYTQQPNKERVWLLINLGESEYKLEQSNKAIGHLEEAKLIALDKGLVELELQCQKRLSEIYDALDNKEKATEARERYLTLKNELSETKRLAIKLDLEKDLSEKEEIIGSNETEISDLEKNNASLLVWGGFLVATIVVLSFVFIVFGNRSRKERRILQEQFLQLKSTFDIDGIPALAKEDAKIQNKTSPYQNSSLTAEDLNRYKDRLLQLMKEEKPYLNMELTQAKLAAELNVPSHHLSEVLNSGFNQNFYDFVNGYRVLEAQKLMQDKAYQDAKILAIAFDSGFKSKTSFNRVFKNLTGSTPSEFRQKQNFS